jgi:hypothetical protein
VYKFLRLFSGTAAIAVLSAVILTGTVQVVRAQDAGGKKWKDTAEYDLYMSAAKNVTANNGTQALADLDNWKTKYPETDYKDDRAVLYIRAYAAAKQPAKAVDAAKDIIDRGVDTVFPDPKAGPPNAIQALFSTVFAITQVTDPTPEELATGEKAAHALLDYNRKPEGVADADWAKARTEQLQPPAKAALMYIAMLPGNKAFQAKNWAGCEEAYKKALADYPQNAAISYQLGLCMRGQANEKPEKRSQAAYEFQRAVMLDPTLGGTSNADQIKKYADGFYTNIHGSDEGLAALKEAAKANPLPPDGFKIKTATEISEEKQAEFEKSNPQLALWMKIKGALADTNGEQYFAGQLKDSQVPQLRGTLVEAKPACRPKELIVAVPLPGNSPTPEITLKLESPIAGKPELNQEFHWEGVPVSFSKDPFMLTMDTSKEKLQGLKTTPCAGAPAGKKSGGVPKKKG